MATTMTINNIASIYLYDFTPTITRAMQNIQIPLEQSQQFAIGLENEATFTISAAVREATGMLSQQKIRQLGELANNLLGFPFVYIQFPAPWDASQFDGFYEIKNMTIPIDYRRLVHIPFQMEVWRKGTLASHRLATFWAAAAEVYAWGGATLTAKRMISLPNNVVDYGDTILETRSATDGSNQVIEDPVRANIVMKSSATISDWYLSECRVYDSVTPGDTVETNWIKVFSTKHRFSGDVIIQNGLLRFIHNVSLSPNVNVWDGTAWKDFGALSVGGSANALLEITKITPEEIRWSLVDATTVIQYLTFVLRRGSYFCKVTLTAGNNLSAVQVGISESGAGYFAQLFNASANGASGLGSLATDPNNNYHCGYNIARNVVLGFVLLNIPANQPVDGGVDTLNESGTWTPGQVSSFFIIGFPQATNPFILATGRATAAKIARECMYSIDQQLTLVPKGYFS